MTRRELKDIATDPAILLLLAVSSPPLFTQDTARDLRKLRIRHEALGVVFHVLEYLQKVHVELFHTHLSHDTFLSHFELRSEPDLLRKRNKMIAAQAQLILKRVGIHLAFSSPHWKTVVVEFPKE